MKRPQKRPPLQPLVLDRQQVIRFQPNQLVVYMYEKLQQHGIGLNELALVAGDDVEDFCQLVQLLGRSVYGYGELTEHVDAREWKRVAAAQRRLENRK